MYPLYGRINGSYVQHITLTNFPLIYSICNLLMLLFLFSLVLCYLYFGKLLRRSQSFVMLTACQQQVYACPNSNVFMPSKPPFCVIVDNIVGNYFYDESYQWVVGIVSVFVNIVISPPVFLVLVVGTNIIAHLITVILSIIKEWDGISFLQYDMYCLFVGWLMAY